MCGITGILYRDRERVVDPGVLSAMADTLVHRGPDAEGIWAEPGIGLAHRRLSIIDLSTAGRQPLGNEDGSLQVVFNGEIYNFADLRADLQKRGHHFRTRTDTEVLVHLYEEEGEHLVDRLRGMFAFALWDRRRRRLLLARDRVGIKPLYVYRDAEKLLFGSELKAILAHPDVDRTMQPEAVRDYFTLGMIPGERSIFKRVAKLRAGHTLSIGHEDLHAAPRRYWRLQSEPQENGDLASWLESLQAKIAETVRLHTVADVPIGAFLSGGLDSSAVVSVLAELGMSVRTFSVGFQEQAFSELPYARQVAQRFHTQHTEEIVTPRAVEGLADLVRYYDEPFADPSAIPTMLISRVARRSVTVALSGDGGDEAFGGYARYGHDLWEASIRRFIPRWLRRTLFAALARSWPRTDWLPRPLRAKSTFTNLSLDAAEAYANTLDIASEPLRRRLLAHGLTEPVNGESQNGRTPGNARERVRLAFAQGNGDPLAAMTATDVELLLPDDFLTKVDRASMACGLEVRPPFVDHELLETAARIPSRFKVRNGQTKWIMKQLFAERLPHDVVWRPKQGFDIPADEWLRGPLRELFEATVLCPRGPLNDLVSREAARRLYRAHLQRRGRYGPVLWALLVFARWLEEYLPEHPAPLSACDKAA